jgi:hypothetical protein
MSNSATKERSGTQRPMMAGPTVWNQASLRAEDHRFTVEPHRASACLRIRSGPGFCVARVLPRYGCTDEEASMLYWGVGAYLGGPQPQNRQGERVKPEPQLSRKR